MTMIVTGGIYKGRKMDVPDSSITRPTLSKVRMGFFNTLYSIIGNFEGLSFLDLFGGSGIMGIEAISRGFSKVTVCEINKNAVKIIKSNYNTLGLTPDLRIGDCIRIMGKFDTLYDVIYVDPPYNSNLYNEVFKVLNLSSFRIIAAEHSENITDKNFELIKIKKYGDKYISFFKK